MDVSIFLQTAWGTPFSLARRKTAFASLTLAERSSSFSRIMRSSALSISSIMPVILPTSSLSDDLLLFLLGSLGQSVGTEWLDTAEVVVVHALLNRRLTHLVVVILVVLLLWNLRLKS